MRALLALLLAFSALARAAIPGRYKGPLLAIYAQPPLMRIVRSRTRRQVADKRDVESLWV